MAWAGKKGTTELTRLGSGTVFAVATHKHCRNLSSDSAGTFSIFIWKINLLQLSGEKQSEASIGPGAICSRSSEKDQARRQGAEPRVGKIPSFLWLNGHGHISFLQEVEGLPRRTVNISASFFFPLFFFPAQIRVYLFE